MKFTAEFCFPAVNHRFLCYRVKETAVAVAGNFINKISTVQVLVLPLGINFVKVCFVLPAAADTGGGFDDR